MNHPEHICRFNDAPQTCECYDEGYKQALAEERDRVRDKIKSMSLKSENSIDKLLEDSEQNRITNLLNQNMVIGYQVALSDLLATLQDKTDKEL